MARDRVFVTSGGDRNGVPNIAIVATDGGSNVRSDLVDDRALDLRNAGTCIVRILQASYLICCKVTTCVIYKYPCLQ